MTLNTSYRLTAAERDEGLLSALQCYAQTAVGLSLYLYGAVSTPSWLSVLLALPLMAALYCLGTSAPDKPSKAYLLPCLVSLMDAQLAFYALCAVISDVLPDVSVMWASLAAAAALAFSLGGIRPHALPQLARIMIPGLIVLAMFCAMCVPGHGKTGHFFPLLGRGPLSILRGAWWIAGAAAGAFCPLMMPSSLQSKKSLARPLLLALLLGAATAGISAYLMPFYSLALPHTMGWRMLIITHMTPSVACWSLEVAAVLTALMLSVSAGVDRAARLMCRAFRRQRAGWPAVSFLLLLLAPAAALGGQEVESALIVLGPLRFPLMAAAFIILRFKARRERA